MSEEPPLLECLKDSTYAGQALVGFKLTSRAVIFDDWFKEGDLGYVFAWRGVGKTWISMGLAIAITSAKNCGP